jgi:chromosome segregation ATPase
MEAKYIVNGDAFSKCSKLSGSEVISSYKTHIHGLEALVKLFEELLHRAEKAECELVNVVKECESRSTEVTTITATLTKIKFDLENCRRERDDACSDLEQLRREKHRIVEEFERERIEFQEKESKDSREITRLYEEWKKVEEERDVACTERDRCRRDKERIVEEFEIERIEFREKETRNTREICRWKESFEGCEEERKIACIELDELREEKERIVVEFERERIEFREREAKCSEEICRWKEEFESCEKECDTIRIDLKETCTILEKEREKVSCSTKTIHELREQIEVLKRSWKTATESEEKAHEEAEHARKEARKADHERDEFQAKLFEAQETICKLQEERQDRDSECAKDLLKCQSDLAECTQNLETYLPPAHMRSHKFCIDKVIYGGKVLDDEKVLKEIQEAADCGKPFKPTNKSCGGDPGSKNSKTFTVAYMVDGKGPTRYVSVQEGNNVRFI